MVIGIVDLDLILNPKSYNLNLTVMQISAYHKSLGDRVKLCFTVNKEELGWYSELYIIYNGEEEVDLDDLFQDDRVILLGKYFYGKYDALSQAIKDTYPDRTIYYNLLSTNYLSKTRSNKLKTRLVKSDFIRLHEKSNLNFVSKESTEIVFYDTNIVDSDYNEIISFNKKINFYYPLVLRNFQQVERWMGAQPFMNRTNSKNFIANNFTEADYKKVLELPYLQLLMFTLRFGDCDPRIYPMELKKCIRVLQIAKLTTARPPVQIGHIQDKDYAFLFKCVKSWYNNNNNEGEDIFHIYFKTKEHYDLITKIKAKDYELYKLLTTSAVISFKERTNK